MNIKRDSAHNKCYVYIVMNGYTARKASVEHTAVTKIYVNVGL